MAPTMARLPSAASGLNSISTGGWFWTMNGTYRDRVGASSGQVASRDEACDLVELAYEELKALVGHQLTLASLSQSDTNQRQT